MKMSKLGPVFTVVVLILTTVTPLATLADRGSAAGTSTPIISPTGTPTPIITENAGKVPGDNDNVVCINTSKVDVTSGPAAGELFSRLGSDRVPDPEAMAVFRGDLLDLLDVLNKLGDDLPPALRLSAKQHILEAERQLLQLTDEQLAMLQSTFRDYGVVKANAKYMKSIVLTPGKEIIGEGDRGAGPSVEPLEGKEGLGESPSSFATAPTSRSTLNWFTTIPTPVPGLAGIGHTGHDDKNRAAGDFTTAESLFPTNIAGPDGRYPVELMFSFMVTLDVLEAADIIAAGLCDSYVIVCPGTNVQDPIECIVKAVLDQVISGVKVLRDGFAFWNGNINSAFIEATFKNTWKIHADLDDHDKNLTTRFNTTDQFLFDFRNLNLRLDIEANLASADDKPHALFALPRSICIPVPKLKDSDAFAPERLAGCGLLEVVSDTVKSTIDMTKAAGYTVNDAQTEFDAGVTHFNKGDYREAYKRFRDAYRRAVKEVKP